VASLDYLSEEIRAEWNRADHGPNPTLMRTAFTEEETAKPQNYLQRPFFVTANVSFHLVCEAKTGEQGIRKADRQNIYSGYIVVRAIIGLHKVVFEMTDLGRATGLSGRILVFSICTVITLSSTTTQLGS
jgi:hypothetical protein